MKHIYLQVIYIYIMKYITCITYIVTNNLIKIFNKFEELAWHICRKYSFHYSHKINSLMCGKKN